jgi:hypothetical protein
MGDTPMPNVDRATRLGIIRTTSMKRRWEYLTKSRRSAYSLFGSGFHGNNELDPQSLLHIYKTYVLPILLHVYGMELLLLSLKPLEQLEMFQKRIIKQLLSLPTSKSGRIYTNWYSSYRSSNTY